MVGKKRRRRKHLGVEYATGEYIPQNYEKAFEWYKKAVDKDLPAAQILLGDMYFNNHGVGLDRKKACELYKKTLSAKDISSVNPDQVV